MQGMPKNPSETRDDWRHPTAWNSREINKKISLNSGYIRFSLLIQSDTASFKYPPACLVDIYLLRDKICLETD